MHLGDHVLPVEEQGCITRESQGRVQHRPVLGHVDVFTGEHGIAAGRHSDLIGQPQQGGVDQVVPQAFGQVHPKIRRSQGVPGDPVRVL